MNKMWKKNQKVSLVSADKMRNVEKHWKTQEVGIGTIREDAPKTKDRWVGIEWADGSKNSYLSQYVVIELIEDYIQ